MSKTGSGVTDKSLYGLFFFYLQWHDRKRKTIKVPQHKLPLTVS